jgi:hypothetical protein
MLPESRLTTWTAMMNSTRLIRSSLSSIRASSSHTPRLSPASPPLHPMTDHQCPPSRSPFPQPQLVNPYSRELQKKGPPETNQVSPPRPFYTKQHHCSPSQPGRETQSPGGLEVLAVSRRSTVPATRPATNAPSGPLRRSRLPEGGGTILFGNRFQRVWPRERRYAEGVACVGGGENPSVCLQAHGQDSCEDWWYQG